MNLVRCASSLLGAWLGISLAACGADPIANPTGTCKAQGSGARAGSHDSAGSTWLPDCANPLRREYWRVFAESEQSAYTIPRLDGSPWLEPACMDAQHPLSALVARYQLCTPAMSAAQVAVVNAMAPADALQLTHFLHGQLRFTVSETSGEPQPFPFPTDVIDACALKPAENSPALDRLCDAERQRLRSGNDIAFSYASAAGELCQRLNELYGIP